MVHLEYETKKNKGLHIHRNYEVIYVISGTCAVLLDEQTVQMGAQDFVVVNSWQRHGYELPQDGTTLIGRFHIPYRQFTEEEDDLHVVFTVSTETAKKQEAILQMRMLLHKLFTGALQQQQADTVEAYQLYFAFLEILFANFASMDKMEAMPPDVEGDRRTSEIVTYVNQNYNKNISLNDLASRLYLSSAYLSKYIKQQLGVNFVDLLNRTRLEHAVDLLLHTDDNIAQIALQVGFSNLASFNRTFKEKYGTTPSAYRKSMRQKGEGAAALLSDEAEGMIRSAAGLQHGPARDSGMERSMRKERIVVRQTSEEEPLSCVWNETINIGTMQELLRSDMQAHVLELKNGLQFKYVRIWDLYAPEMYLDRHEPGQVYNFTRLDRVLDFLVKNHLIPHIDVGNKPKRLTFASQTHLSNPRKGDDPFKSSAMITYFFSALMRHLIRRYGAEALDDWVFEYWMEEPEDTDTGSKWLLYSEEMIDCYLKNFSDLAAAVRWFGTNLKVGGGGFSIRFGKDQFRSVIRKWTRCEQKPDFVSIYVFPYEMDEYDDTIDCRVVRTDYMKTCLQFAHHVMHAEKLDAQLIVSAYNMTISHKNVMNDTVYKGAWMVKNIMDCMDETSVLTYWTGSDLFAEYNAPVDFISGGMGLLTRDGIRKPAWYAVEFMNSLERFVCKKTENVLVTQGKYRNYRIVCHNFKPLNEHYYRIREDAITLADVEQRFFDDQRMLRVSLDLPAMPDDVYRIKVMRVNRESGSVLDEWIRMSAPEYMDTEDLEYLKRRCVPGTVIFLRHEEKGRITFTTYLEPNEIQLILADCQGRF